MSNKLLYSIIVVIALSWLCSSIEAKVVTQSKLEEALGLFPNPPPLQIEVLETVPVDSGLRQLIEYVVEEADTIFDRLLDRVRAYLFIPPHQQGQRLPAMVAIHQDGPSTHLGKAEPAGLGGAEDQHYGLELFERGHVVICPDRYYHAERRRIPDAADAGSEMMRDLGLWLKWAGQLILSGRTHFGKEVYDLMRAVDVLSTLDSVDSNRIGAIGHSAGGNVMVYFMFMDQRIKLGVSSCGFYELLEDFNDHDRSFSNSVFAIPGLATIGRSTDYLASIAPRPVLLTRGLHELSTEEQSQEHIEKTKNIEAYARNKYSQLQVSDQLKVIYFDGGHEFPEKVRITAYEWIDSFLKQ